MENLPTELIQHIALYVGWDGYASLRTASSTLHAQLPWAYAMAHGKVRTVPIHTLPWHLAWFEKNLSLDCVVQGTWILDGFHGVVFFIDVNNASLVGESVCAKGQLEGTLVLKSPWRGGMMRMELFKSGLPHRT